MKNALLLSPLYVSGGDDNSAESAKKKKKKHIRDYTDAEMEELLGGRNLPCCEVVKLATQVSSGMICSNTCWVISTSG